MSSLVSYLWLSYMFLLLTLNHKIQGPLWLWNWVGCRSAVWNFVVKNSSCQSGDQILKSSRQSTFLVTGHWATIFPHPWSQCRIICTSFRIYTHTCIYCLLNIFVRWQIYDMYHLNINFHPTIIYHTQKSCIFMVFGS